MRILIISMGLSLIFSAAQAKTGPVLHTKTSATAPVKKVSRKLAAADTPIESVVSPPDHDKLTPTDYANVDNSTDNDGGESDYTYTTQDNNPGVVTAFGFINKGGNSALTQTSDVNGFPSRDFVFDFKGRATQDIHFEVRDAVEQSDSHNLQSNIYLFPRKVVPAIDWASVDGATFRVTLPTGEVEEFDKAMKTMVSGPLKETSPVDLNPNRFNRKYPQISYTSTNPKNVFFKQDSRSGGDFRTPTTTIIQGSKTCKVKTTLLFDTASGGNDANGWVPQGDISFKFATDADFNSFLKTKCHMDFLN